MVLTEKNKTFFFFFMFELICKDYQEVEASGLSQYKGICNYFKILVKDHIIVLIQIFKYRHV